MARITNGKLPSKLYKVEIPVIATYTEEEMALYGMPMSVVNNSKFERDYNARVVVMLNIDRMIDIYALGFPIRLINSDEVTEIYNILDNYVNDRHEDMTTLNRPHYNDERMTIIDRFAQEMFGINKINIVNKETKLNNGYDIGLTHLLPEYRTSTINRDVSNIPSTSKWSRRNNLGVIDNTPIVEDVQPLYNNYNSISNNLTYLNQNTPNIDMDSIKRTPRFRINKDVE